MNNWRELPAGRELDRVVAERLGWHVDNARLDGQGGYWCIIEPAGVPATIAFTRSPAGWPTPEQAWEAGPHYSTDTNAALTLGKPAVWWDGKKWRASFDYSPFNSAIELNPYIDGYEKADTPAHAIARAWLAWKEAQG